MALHCSELVESPLTYFQRDAVQGAMRSQGLKQWWVAEYTGVHRTTLRRWLKGDITRIHKCHMERLAEILALPTARIEILHSN